MAPGAGYGLPSPVGGYGYGYLPPVHKPGVVALRPLGLGDIYDGAFQTIRRNPQAMVGLAALVSAVAMVVPALSAVVLAASGLLDLSFGPDGGDAEAALTSVLQLLGSLFGGLSTVLLNGMIISVVAEAVLGRRSSIGDAWRATRRRRLRLVGLLLLEIFLVVLMVGIPVAVGLLVGSQAGTGSGVAAGGALLLGLGLLMAFLHYRYFLLAPAALVLERTTVPAALRRAGQLSRRQWWRLFGIQLLTVVVVGIVGEIIALPLAAVGSAGPLVFPGAGGALVLVLVSYLSQIIVSTITTPFTAGVTALQYVDQRIRKEALDVELIAAAAQQPASRA